MKRLIPLTTLSLLFCTVSLGADPAEQTFRVVIDFSQRVTVDDSTAADSGYLTEFDYLRLRSGQSVKLFEKSTRVVASEGQKVVQNVRMTREALVDGDNVSRTQDLPLDRRNMLYEKYDKPFCEIKLDAHGREMERKPSQLPVHIKTSASFIHNAQLFHPGFPAEESWEHPAALNKITGKLRYTKIGAMVNGKQKVKVEGTLSEPQLMKDGAERGWMSITISGEQHYDSALNDYISGNVNGKLTGDLSKGTGRKLTTSGTIKIKFEHIPADTK